MDGGQGALLWGLAAQCSASWCPIYLIVEGFRSGEGSNVGNGARLDRYKTMRCDVMIGMACMY